MYRNSLRFADSNFRVWKLSLQSCVSFNLIDLSGAKPMARSRTIKTLAVLVGAMTFGAFALLVFQPDPIKSPIKSLAALMSPSQTPESFVRQTDTPIQALKWSNIIIHSSATARDIEDNCHFILMYDNDGEKVNIAATELWKKQLEGNHIEVPGFNYNATSIGICLRGDFAHSSPSKEMYNTLLKLVWQLQRECDISGDHVYLYSDLVLGSDSPGQMFPKRAFDHALLRPGR